MGTVGDQYCGTYIPSCVHIMPAQSLCGIKCLSGNLSDIVQPNPLYFQLHSSIRPHLTRGRLVRLPVMWEETLRPPWGASGLGFDSQLLLRNISGLVFLGGLAAYSSTIGVRGKPFCLIYSGGFFFSFPRRILYIFGGIFYGKTGLIITSLYSSLVWLAQAPRKRLQSRTRRLISRKIQSGIYVGFVMSQV